MKKRQTYQENIIIVKVNVRLPKYMKRILEDLKGNVDCIEIGLQGTLMQHTQ